VHHGSWGALWPSIYACAAGQQLQTLARDGNLDGFMQTYDVLIDERTGAMRGARSMLRDTRHPRLMTT